jgi:hypothetical protein
MSCKLSLLMRNFFLILMLLLSALPAMANEVANKNVPNAQMVGKGRFTFALWNVYDAMLYAPEGKWSPDKPYALSLRYLLDLKGTDIAKRSVEEMKKQGFSNKTKLSIWQKEMGKIFPNVTKGSELTAVLTDKKSTVFYSKEKFIGTIEDAEFGTYFFNIWLGKKTSDPVLRRKLLGL